MQYGGAIPEECPLGMQASTDFLNRWAGYWWNDDLDKSDPHHGVLSQFVIWKFFFYLADLSLFSSSIPIKVANCS
jgi:hypothetical protein